MTVQQANFKELYAQLNPEQKAAVDHVDGPLIVLAGPGTGKTQIIAMRIARLLQVTQMNPQNILCLTFTESGVVAMRKRLISIIGTPAYHVRIHTFHSFCNDVIKEWPEKFLFARELEPLTAIERIQLFQSLVDELPADSVLKPFGDPYFYVRDLMKAIQDLKRENVEPETLDELVEQQASAVKEHEAALTEFVAIHGRSLKEEDLTAIHEITKGSIFEATFESFFTEAPTEEKLRKKARTQLKNDIKKMFNSLLSQIPRQQALSQVYHAYQAALKTRGRYDFEDMILFVVRAFKKDPDLLAHYQEQFQYILVDEYQDTNGAQNETVRLLGEFFENPNLFVVGDDKQSIYRFQGASLENILYFYDLYRSDIKLVKLKQNYRSSQVILNASDSLIHHNTTGVDQLIPNVTQSLDAALGRPNISVQIAELDSPQTEAYFLAKQIQKLIEEGCSPKEIAVLYRNHWDARDLMDLFLRLDIPFKLEAGENILEDPLLHKFITLLKYIHAPNEENHLFHVLNFDFLGFEPMDVAKLTHAAYRQRRSLFEQMTEDETFKDFAQQLAQWQQAAHNLTLSEFFDHLLKESGYLNFILNAPEKVEHLNRLNSLFDEIKKLNRAKHSMTLAELIEYLDLHQSNRIAINSHELQTKKNAVRLMTAHKSKGLEFNHVFVIKCVDKHWGNTIDRTRLHLPAGILKKVPSGKERNEDERRLFYVALTRAKQSVTLTYSNTSDSGRAQVPSIFLEEINLETRQKLDTSDLENEALDRLSTVFLKPVPQDHSEEERAFVKGLLENYTMSVTHLNNYLRCPRLFYYRNVLHVPSAKNKHAAFGSAVHEALKDLHFEHKETLPSKDFLLRQFERHLKREVLSEQEFRGGLEFGKHTLDDYYDTYQNQFQANTMAEYDFRPHGVNLDGIPLTGKLDKIEIVDPEAKTVNVVDYKTGNPDSKAKELRGDGEYKRQIVFYKLLCDLSTQFPYTMVSGEIDFVQKSKREDTFKKARIQVTPEDVAQLKSTIKDVYADIQNLAFLTNDEFATCGECEYCEASAV